MRSTSLTQWAIGYTVAYLALELIGTLFFSPICWGLNLLHFLPWAVTPLFLLCGSVAIALVMARNLDDLIGQAAHWMVHQRLHFLIIVIALYFSAALVFRVQIPLLGDSFLLVDSYLDVLRGQTPMFWLREPGSLLYFYAFAKLGGVTSYEGLLNAFLAAEMLLGAGMIVLNYFLVSEAFTSQRQRLLAFFFLLSLPTMLLFFGYLETYAVVTFVLALFLLAILKYWNGRLSFTLVCACYCLLAASHTLMLVLLPALGYMGYREWRQRGLQSVATGIAVMIVFLAGVYFMVNGHWKAIFPPEKYTHYLSPFEVHDGFQPYTLFSPYHFFDLFNQIILVAPFGIFLFAAVLNHGERKRFVDPLVVFLVLCSLFLLGFLFCAKFDLGQAADWDVTAPSLYVVQFLLVLLFFRVHGERAQRIFPLIAMLMIFHTGIWIGLNSTHDAALRRFESLGESPVLAPFAYQFNIWHLAAYDLHEGDPDAAIDCWRMYTKRFPDDTVGYKDIIALASKKPNGKIALIDSSYRRWLVLTPDNRSVVSFYTNFCLTVGAGKLQRGATTEAGYYFNQAIAADSTCFRAYSLLAGLVAGEGDTNKAIQLLERSIRINPLAIEGHIGLGRHYSLTGNDGKAVEAWGAVLRLDSSYSDGYTQLAASYRRMGKNGLAESTLKLGMRSKGKR